MLTPILLKNDEKNIATEHYLIEEQDDFYLVCSPLCGQWLKAIQKEHWVINCDFIRKDSFELEHINESSLQNASKDTWIFDFELNETDIHKFYYIARFFETYLSLHDLSLVKRIEKTLSQMEWFLGSITDDVLERILRFILEKQYDENERLRILVSDRIQNHLRK